MTRLRSAMIAGVVTLSCLGMSSQPADAQMRGGGFGGGHGGFNGGFNHGGFDNRGFCCNNRFFFGFGFPGYGFGGYPYYPYYPAYYPPYPYYPPYSGYPAAAPPAAPAYPATASPGATRVDPVTVLVQSELQRQGYDVGPIDGLLGPRTKTAIREYQQRNGLPVDGVLSHSLLDHMQAHPTG